MAGYSHGSKIIFMGIPFLASNHMRRQYYITWIEQGPPRTEVHTHTHTHTTLSFPHPSLLSSLLSSLVSVRPLLSHAQRSPPSLLSLVHKTPPLLSSCGTPSSLSLPPLSSSSLLHLILSVSSSLSSLPPPPLSHPPLSTLSRGSSPLSLVSVRAFFLKLFIIQQRQAINHCIVCSAGHFTFT